MADVETHVTWAKTGQDAATVLGQQHRPLQQDYSEYYNLARLTAGLGGWLQGGETWIQTLDTRLPEGNLVDLARKPLRR